MSGTDLIEPALIVGAIFGVWRLIKSDVESVRADVRENRRESAREHQELDAKFTARFNTVDPRFDRVEADINTRFNVLDERDRRRLRAMLE